MWRKKTETRKKVLNCCSLGLVVKNIIQNSCVNFSHTRCAVSDIIISSRWTRLLPTWCPARFNYMNRQVARASCLFRLNAFFLLFIIGSRALTNFPRVMNSWASSIVQFHIHQWRRRRCSFAIYICTIDLWVMQTRNAQCDSLANAETKINYPIENIVTKMQ